MISRILLTGGTGFIGRNLVRTLLDEPNVEILHLGRRPVSQPGVEDIIVPDLTDQSVRTALHGRAFDGVMHLAAAGVSPGDREVTKLRAINTDLTASLVSLAASQGARAIVIAGSSAEYASSGCNTALGEDAPLETGKIYGASKAAGGIAALAEGERHDIAVGVIRLFNIFGPGEDQHRLLPSLVRDLQAGRRVALSMGTQVRDFVHVNDACAGLCQAWKALSLGGMPTGAYNLATGQGHTVADFARGVANVLDVPEELLGFGDIDMRPDDIPYLVGDATRLRQACGWVPSLSFQEGLRAAVKALTPTMETAL